MIGKLRKTCNVMRRNSESSCRLKSPWWRLWKKSSKRYQTVWGKCSQRTRVGDCCSRRNVGRMYSVHFFEMRENKADQGGGGATQKSNCRRELQNSSFPVPTPGMDCSQSLRPTEKVDSPIQTSRLAEANPWEHVFAQMCCAPFVAWRPGSTAPTMMVAVPPAQGGVQ